jgi:hexosaminidase
MNVAAPEAIQFTKDVVDELIALFPFGYIHLGGDECPTSKWENNELCKQRLAAIGSTKFRDLQTDFYKQVQDHILAKPKAQQRKLIFWNEMLHGNTSQLKDVTVMAWIGADNAAKVAAERGFDNILTPQIPYYINRRQSKDPSEPRSQGHGTETLERVYSYIPANGIAKELLPKYKGVQANFWTEYVFDNETLEYLAFPRLIAVAEAGWTIQARRNYTNFVERLNQHVPYFDLINLSYGKHVVPVKK